MIIKELIHEEHLPQLLSLRRLLHRLLHMLMHRWMHSHVHGLMQMLALILSLASQPPHTIYISNVIWIASLHLIMRQRWCVQCHERNHVVTTRELLEIADMLQSPNEVSN